jgi:ATP-dependent Clp protease ATP-binding subunit ClpC
MFERFTDDARRVVVYAQEEARRLNHDRIGAGHLLLGLIGAGPGVAGVRVLARLEATPEALRNEVEARIPPSDDPGPGGHIPFTPQAKKVLELSLREAIGLGHRHIGTEHILLGMARQREGVAADVLRAKGVEYDQIRERVLEISGESPEAPAAGAYAFASPEGSLRERLDRIEARLAEVSARLDALERRAED